MSKHVLYRPEMCQQIIDFGKQGLSIEAMASKLGVACRTVQQWRIDYPEFGAAMEAAVEAEMEFWENLALKHVVEFGGSGKLNSGVWIRSMAARFPKKYRENKVELSGPDGGPIQTQKIERVIIDVAQNSDT